MNIASRRQERGRLGTGRDPALVAHAAMAAAVLVTIGCGGPGQLAAHDPSSAIVQDASTPSASPGRVAVASHGGSADAATSPSATQARVFDVRDGTPWIAYQWGDDQGGDGIFLVRPDGTGRHQLVTDMSGQQWQPDWSPDGRRLAFIEDTPDDRNELWMVDIDGQHARKLWSCDVPCNSISYPDWTPADPGAIYFAQDADAGPDAPPTTFRVSRLDIGSGRVRTVLTRTDGATAEQPRISHDGKRVAYMRFRDILDESAGSAIFVADLKGGRERRLTPWNLFGAGPDWLPDGRIVFNSYALFLFNEGDTGPANLYVMRSDGSHRSRITDFTQVNTGATQARVVPGGTAIAFTRVDPGEGVRRLARVDPAGRHERWLTSVPTFGTHPDVRPTGAP